MSRSRILQAIETSGGGVGDQCGSRRRGLVAANLDSRAHEWTTLGEQIWPLLLRSDSCDPQVHFK